MGPWGPSVCPGQEWKGVGKERPFPSSKAYHTATATIFMTDSLRHWQKLTRGAPLSPMRPSMMPVGAGTREHITDHTGQGEGTCDSCTGQHMLLARWGRTPTHTRVLPLADFPAASTHQCCPCSPSPSPWPPPRTRAVTLPQGSHLSLLSLPFSTQQQVSSSSDKSAPC